MSDLVKIKVMSEDNKQLMALFSSTGVPNEANYTLERDETSKQTKLKALDLNSNFNFIGEESMTKSSEYYLGVRERDVIEIHPICIYRMDPLIGLNERTSSQNSTQTPLTVKEEMEEMKEKFGSRRTQRSLASKRKYAIEFGEEDVEHIETQTKSVVETNSSESANERTTSDSIDILPKQNRNAICVEEVYDINEIIRENERNILLQLETELFDGIDNSFIKNLMSNPIDSEKKLISIYLNLIFDLLNLKSQDLRKADPLPSLNNEVKEFLCDRYLTTQILNSNKHKYLLNNKEKDRLLIYGIILSLVLHNYRPIELELLQKSFKVGLRQLRRIVEIIGCYVESIKNSSGVNTKTVVFRIPLNSLPEPKKHFKRR